MTFLRFLLISACLLVISYQTKAQDLPPDDEIFTLVDKKPEPAGGMEGWAEYLRNNLKFPLAARDARAGGRVYVQFVVNADGSISDVKAVKGVGYGCDEEAERVIRNAPDWTPGEQNGEKVKVRMIVPIVFKVHVSSSPSHGIRKPISRRPDPVMGSRVDAKDPVAFSRLTVKPDYEGSTEAFFYDVKEYVQYPEEALEKGITGVVRIGFTVDEQGQVINLEPINSLGHGLDEVAMNFARNMRGWSIGKKRKKTVPVDLVLSVAFHPDVYPFKQLPTEEEIQKNTTKLSNVVVGDSTFAEPEIKPTPAGGMEGWAEYLRRNLRYPGEATRSGIEGRLYVQFIVQPDGSITDVKTIKGIGGGCDEEAERIMRHAPAWNPGILDGKPVAVKMVMPIVFSLGK